MSKQEQAKATAGTQRRTEVVREDGFRPASVIDIAGRLRRLSSQRRYTLARSR